jgi:hypothetical protein
LKLVKISKERRKTARLTLLFRRLTSSSRLWLLRPTEACKNQKIESPKFIRLTSSYRFWLLRPIIHLQRIGEGNRG